MAGITGGQSGEPEPAVFHSSRWIRSQLYGVLTSVGLHVLLLLLMAWIIINRDDGDDVTIDGAMMADAPVDGLVLDSSLFNTPEFEEAKAAPWQFSELDWVEPQPGGTQATSATNPSTGEGESGDDEGLDSKFPLLKIPEGAVRKGSFTVWTDPKDPQPRKDYFIVVEVQLPKGMKVYRPSDLTGLVIGTDQYRGQIPKLLADAKVGKKVQVFEGRVQLRMRVPGANKLVRDKIQIRSQLLKEEQQLEIEF